MASSAQSGGGVGGLVVAGLLIFGLVHGCGGSTNSDYHSHDTTVTNPDGSTTYTDNYNVGNDNGSFSCTTSSDYATTDCSGSP